MKRTFTIKVDKHCDWVTDDYYGIGSQVQFGNVEHSINFVKGAIIHALGSAVGNKETIPDEVNINIKFKTIYEK